MSLRPAQDTEQDLEWEAGGGGGQDTGTRHSGTLFLTQHSLRRERQVGLFELEANLVYTESSRRARLHSRLCFKQVTVTILKRQGGLYKASRDTTGQHGHHCHSSFENELLVITYFKL